ncbi:unnamed protein product [Parajaminaea phylloscopi]
MVRWSSLLSTAIASAFAAHGVQALWPQPQQMTTGKGVRSFDAQNIKLTSGDYKLPNDVKDAFDRMVKGIVSTPYGHVNPPKDVAGGQGGINEVKIQFGSLPASKDRRAPDVGRRAGNHSILTETLTPIERLNEEYKLKIPASGPIEIHADSNLGILRAFATIELLVYSTGQGPSRFVENTPIEISDKPAYPYRGFLIDTSRNFYTIAAIKRQLDAASLVKLNQFHWHIVDSHSFPLGLEGKLSKLSELGAYSPAQVYRPEDIRDIVQYAGVRGINVNVEIDMPGHTYAGVKDYDPELVVCPNKADWVNWANEPPSGELNLRSPKTKAYVKDLIDATSNLFPGPYFGTGNDEVNLKCYGAKNKSDIDASLLKPFVQHAHKVISDRGKTPMVWEEAAIDFPETGKALQPDTLVQVWVSVESVGKALAANPKIRVINSPVNAMYLDVGRGEFTTGATGQSWAPYCTWGSIYTYDLLNGTTKDNEHRIVGSEVLLWSEQSDDATVDQLLWPRAAALAEIVWTGRGKTINGKYTKLDIQEATKRLNELRYRLVNKGVNATPLQPQFCLNNNCPSAPE